jgi:PLP dependent protein
VTQITDHLAEIRGRVSFALERAGRRADDVTIVAVSKGQPAEAIAAAFAAGQRDFGESYMQEALAKMRSLEGLDIVWHYIGPIQSNKTRAIAENFDWVHTLDREKVALRLGEQRPFYAPPLNVCIQVNLAAEPQKAGIARNGVAELAGSIGALPRLKLRGLMGVPPAGRSRADTAAFFRELAALEAELNGAGFALDSLSMGMSGDFETAIEHGSTLVRIGTALFGPRRA